LNGLERVLRGVCGRRPERGAVRQRRRVACAHARPEILDKGSINQRAVLRHRDELVAALYSADRLYQVIEVDDR
jgi:hypothetical protein